MDLLRDQYGRVAAAHSRRHSIFGKLRRLYRLVTGSEVEQPAHRILYAREDGGLSIVVPAPEMLFYLTEGGIIRDMRQVGAWDERGTPQMEGSGRLLAPMSYKQALEYIAWRDVPAGVMRVQIVPVTDVPEDRTFRNAWQMKVKGSNYHVAA